MNFMIKINMMVCIFFKNQSYTFGQNNTINIIQFGNIPLCRYWPQYAEYNVLNYSGSHFEIL